MIVTSAALVLGLGLSLDASCDWSRPGLDPYRGPVAKSVAMAVARYGFDSGTQAQLVAKAKRLQPDGYMVITRDDITSPQGLVTGFRDMHFGQGRLCRGEIHRDAWRADQAEVALIYCAGGQCIAVPVVCGNVSRVEFAPFVSEQPHADSGFRAWKPWTPEPGPEPKLNRVSEPSSLLLLLAALPCLLWARRSPTVKEGE